MAISTQIVAFLYVIYWSIRFVDSSPVIHIGMEKARRMQIYGRASATRAIQLVGDLADMVSLSNLIRNVVSSLHY